MKYWMRRGRWPAYLLVLFFIAGGRAVFPDAATDAPFQVEANPSPSANKLLARFPFVFDGRILIPIKVNDSAPLDIILDTGFGQRILLLMHKETGNDLRLAYVRSVDAIRGAGSGKNKTALLTAGEHLSLPGIDLGKTAVAVIDESREDSPQSNLGVIGGAIFIPYVVGIDFKDSAISLYDPRSFVPEKGWEEIPLVFEKNLPVLETTVGIRAGTAVRVRLIVDTGGKPPLALAVRADGKLKAPPQVVRFLSGTGFRGDVFSDLGRLPELRIGAHHLVNVVSAFWKGDEAPFLEEGNVDGPLGLGSLYRFNMIFDYAHRRMFIKPNEFYSDPFELNMAGMAIEKTVSGDLVVYHVMDGSEAANKGLQKGDVLEKADGKDARAYGYLTFKRLFERAGKTVVVKFRRAGEQRSVKLKLKRII